MTGRWRRGASALLAGGVILLAGCAQAPDPGIVADTSAPSSAPSATTMANPVPSITVTVPALPAAGPADDPGGDLIADGSPAGAAEGDVINSETTTVTVDLDGCRGCREVLATAPAVAGELSAALVATKRGAALVAVRPDGSTGGQLAVAHGVTFPAPADGVLPCDSGGRCVVLAQRQGGAAIASAYALGADGTWSDLSGSNAFPSATERAGVIDVGGEIGIAVQESGEGRTGWIVLTWSGARYTVVGCAADSAKPPTAGELSVEACLS